MPFTIVPLLACCSLTALLPEFSLEPGESAIFRLHDGHPVLVRRAGRPRSGELRASLRWERGRTTLRITNNSGQWLNYSAILGLRGRREEPGRVCTLKSGDSGAFEVSQQRLRYVSLSDFRPAAEGEQSCQ